MYLFISGPDNGHPAQPCPESKNSCYRCKAPPVSRAAGCGSRFPQSHLTGDQDLATVRCTSPGRCHSLTTSKI